MHECVPDSIPIKSERGLLIIGSDSRSDVVIKDTSLPPFSVMLFNPQGDTQAHVHKESADPTSVWIEALDGSLWSRAVWLNGKQLECGRPAAIREDDYLTLVDIPGVMPCCHVFISCCRA